MNGTEAIRSYFQQMVGISEGDWAYFNDKLKYKEFKRSDIITRQGRTENCLYFLHEGTVRIILQKEKEITTDFAFPKQFFSSYSSFINRVPSLFEIRPVTSKVACFYLTHTDLNDIYAHTQCGEKIGRIAAEQLFLRKSAREAALLSLNPKEKYLLLLEEQPHLIQTIPMKYLASYLGITPETLSRIRASIS